jgi:hypothetical protein
MFHHDISYALMRERMVELHRQAAADRQAARLSRRARAKKARHTR